MIQDFLVKHAISNVWCQPFMDYQSIFSLSRITPDVGVQNRCTVLWDPIELPTQHEYYHVYQVGGNGWHRLSWPGMMDQWFTLRYWGERNSQVIDLHLNNGKHLPLSTAYLRRTRDGNFIVAIKYEKKRFDIVKHNPYLRSYRNEWFNTNRSQNLSYNVQYGGGKVIDARDVTRWMQETVLLKNEPGIVNIYHNGDLIERIVPALIKVGDYLEYVYDGAVSRVVDFKVSDLPDFMSELDRTKKYLLHPVKDEQEHTIRYRDDVDVYLYRKTEDGSKIIGRYYHRYTEPSLRMVTHYDYSIPVSHVLGYLNDPEDSWAKYEDLYLRLHIREGGYDRPLVNEANRISELYRLKDVEILDAMLGRNAVLDEWKVQTLESSLYTWIMRQWYPTNIKFKTVIDAYGYNATSKLIADTPQEVIIGPNGNYVELPVGLQLKSTIYEYDENGFLLEYHLHLNSDRYFTRNPKTRLIEGIIGEGVENARYIRGNDPVETKENFNYQLLVCKKEKGIPTEQYIPAVEGTHYQMVGLRIEWIHDHGAWEGLVGDDDWFITYTQEDNRTKGVLDLTFTENRDDRKIAVIQPEKIGVWLDGVFLTEGFDYILEWPKLYLVNPKRIEKEKHLWTVRLIGFGDENNHRKLTQDVGFVQHGLVSLDGRYNTRQDKVFTTFLDGALQLNQRVGFAEDWDDTEGPHRNGQVYTVDSLPIPIRGLKGKEYDDLRAAGRDTDERLEDYLSIRYPEPQFDTPSPILEYHYQYSPLMTTLTNDLLSGVLIAPFEPEEVTEVSAALEPYLHLLPYEPARHDINTNYVRLIPHPWSDAVDIGVRNYRFLESVNRLYLGGKLELRNYYRVEGLI